MTVGSTSSVAIVVSHRMARDQPEITRRGADASEHFEAYGQYNRTLRIWFVAFGVGGPVLFLVEPDLRRELEESGKLACVVYPFLLGVALQIIGALVNKAVAWSAYYDEAFKRTYKCQWQWIRVWWPSLCDWYFSKCKWFVNQYWFDAIIDVATFGLFALATIRLLHVFGLGF